MAKGISAWYSAAGKLNCKEDGRRKASKLCDDTGMTNVSPWSLFFFQKINAVEEKTVMEGLWDPEPKVSHEKNEAGHGETKNHDYLQDTSTLTF